MFLSMCRVGCRLSFISHPKKEKIQWNLSKSDKLENTLKLNIVIESMVYGFKQKLPL